MYIKRLVVKNVGPFKDLNVKLRRGLIGVFGANGAGKTWFLNIMYAVLTNDFGRFIANKDKCVSDFRKDGEPSYARIEAEHNGTSFVLQRSLNSVEGNIPHSLTVGGEVIRDDPKIQEFLRKLFGVDLRLLNICAFKQQERIFDIISAKGAERLLAFHHIFGIESCELVWKTLGRIVDQATRAVIADDTGTLLASLTEARTKKATLKEEIAAVKRRMFSSSVAQERCEYSVKWSAKLAELVQERKGIVVSKDEKYLSDKDQARYDELKGLITKSDKANKIHSDAETARILLVALEKRKRWERSHSEVKETFAKLSAVVLPPKPEGFDDKFDADDLRSRLAVAKSDYERLQKEKEAFAEGVRKGATVCRSCGAPAAAGSEYRKKVVADCSAAMAAMQELQLELQKWQDFSGRLEEWRKVVVTHERNVYDANIRLTELVSEAPEEVPVDAKTLQAQIDASTRLLQKQAEIQAEYAKLERMVARAKAEQESKLKRRKELKATIEQIQANLEGLPNAEEAAKRLANHRAAELEHASKLGTLSALKLQIQGIKDALEKAREVQARQKLEAEAAEILTKARDVFHKENLPALISAANLKRLESDINRYLSGFDSPFTIECSEDLEFVAFIDGRKPRSANQLSTGQKAILAISFWLAVSDILGFLALDEPTANLDERNRAYLAETLTSLAGAVRGSRQVLMITHADELQPCFDQVVKL